MVSSSTHLPKPKDWDDFERKMTVLAQEWLSDPHAEGNGRLGQAQAGVDVFGRRDSKTWVGIQCKKKWETEVTEDELKAEVEKAKKFKPTLSEFILATTAPRDQKLQRLANELTAANIGFSVHVWGWERIEELVSGFNKAIKAFDPAYHPTLSADIQLIGGKVDALQEQLQSTGLILGSRSQSTALTKSDLDDSTVIHGKISTIQSLIEDDEILTAERQVLKLIESEWGDASRSEKYRMLVTKANLAIHREIFQDAGQLLLDAFNECPDHKNAQRNQAIGLLLTGDATSAIKIAEQILVDAPQDKGVIDTLIQSRFAIGLSDPFAGLDKEQQSSVLASTLKIQIARENSDPEWRNLANAARKAYPDSKFIGRYFAEAIIDEIMEDAPLYIAGEGSQKFDFQSLAAAAEILSEQTAFLDEVNGHVPSSMAHNAALAFRMMGDAQRVTRQLEIGYKHNSSDIAIREQLAGRRIEEGNPENAIELLSGLDLPNIAQLTLAAAYLEKGSLDDAEALVEGFVPKTSNSAEVHNFLALKYGIFQKRKDLKAAKTFFSSYVNIHKSDLISRIFLARVFRLSGDPIEAQKILEATSVSIDPDTPFSIVRDAANEAFKLELYELVLNLLPDRVAFDHDNEGLWQCLAASINGNFFKTASTLFSRMSESLKSERWVRRSQIILAHRTGDKNASRRMGEFLKDYPHDAEMRLARIGMWQRDGFEANIRRDVKSTDFGKLEGTAISKLEYFRAAVSFGQAARGVKGAYQLLLENWDDSACHMAFHGLFIANDGLKGLNLYPTAISEDTVATVETDGELVKYRIEKQKPQTFGDEWLCPTEKFAAELLGKQVADTIVINQGTKTKTLKVVQIKSVFLDTFHRSIENFNTRFPHSNGMMRFTFDENSDDPFAEIREITKQGVERDKSLLNFYREHTIPMSFLAALLGKDAVECAIAVPTEGIPFKVSRGTKPERENAKKSASSIAGDGIVVDAITLALINRLKLQGAVEAVCGKLHTPQATLDLFAKRLIEAKQAIGKQPGTLSYDDGKLVMTEITDSQWQEIIDHRKREYNWIRGNVEIIETLPAAEIVGEPRKIMEMVGFDVCAPAIAANGIGMPLLSDDLGFREWAEHSFQLQVFWLQPILMVARDRGIIASDQYCDTLCQMVASGFELISLDVECFLHQLRLDGFEITPQMKKMLDTISGPNADLLNNLGVAANIIDALYIEPCENYQRLNFASEVIACFAKTRWEKVEAIISSLVQRCGVQSEDMAKHLIGWLIGHSIGSKEFDILRKKYRL